MFWSARQLSENKLQSVSVCVYVSIWNDSCVLIMPSRRPGFDQYSPPPYWNCLALVLSLLLWPYTPLQDVDMLNRFYRHLVLLLGFRSSLKSPFRQIYGILWLSLAQVDLDNTIHIRVLLFPLGSPDPPHRLSLFNLMTLVPIRMSIASKSEDCFHAWYSGVLENSYDVRSLFFFWNDHHLWRVALSEAFASKDSYETRSWLHRRRPNYVPR